MGDSKWLAGSDLPSFLHSRRCSTSWSVPPSLRGLVWSPCMCPTLLLLYISQPPDRSPTNPACMCINICLQCYCIIINCIYLRHAHPQEEPNHILISPSLLLSIRYVYVHCYQMPSCALFWYLISCWVAVFLMLSCHPRDHDITTFLVLSWIGLLVDTCVVDGMEQCKRGEFVGEIWELSHVCFVDFISPLSRFCFQLLWAFLLYVTHLYNVSLCQNTMIPRPF